MPGYVYVVLALAVLIAIVTVVGRISTRRMAAARVGENLDTFRESFAWEAVPADVLRAVYAKFQEWVSGFGVAEFPVRADDNITRVYGMADEDLEGLVNEVLAECGRRLPPAAEMRRMSPIPLATVRDFARFVATCPAGAEHIAGTS
jgi:hypothetical protein